MCVWGRGGEQGGGGLCVCVCDKHYLDLICMCVCVCDDHCLDLTYIVKF